MPRPLLTHEQLEAAYRQYGAMVHRRCQRILGSAAAADDAVQETFIRAWRYSSSFIVADSRLAWLYRVAERRCFSQLARGKRSLSSLVETNDVRSSAAELEQRDQLLRFLDRFDERIQRMLVLYLIDGLSQDEVAIEIGWSRPTVAKKLAWVYARAEKWSAVMEKSHA